MTERALLRALENIGRAKPLPRRYKPHTPETFFRELERELGPIQPPLLRLHEMCCPEIAEWREISPMTRILYCPRHGRYRNPHFSVIPAHLQDHA